MASSPEHVEVNRERWTRSNAEFTDSDAEDKWAREEIVWGSFEWPESELGILGDVAGLDIVELGCGTAYFSAWLARRGARPVGVDVTPAQLDTAHRMQERHGLEFPLVEANAEDVPLPDASFDLALSEFGASLWCDPEHWIPEAARLLRPGWPSCLHARQHDPGAVLRRGARDRAARARLAEIGRMDFRSRGRRDRVPPADRASCSAFCARAGFELLELHELLAPDDA